MTYHEGWSVKVSDLGEKKIQWQLIKNTKI